ncbi:MAG: nucleotidyltransferase domain-containing protein [Armatimonadetes bacterium]|nr:nucleotidyltransferase domain-containing protein [Armatimonadota bacterium]
MNITDERILDVVDRIGSSVHPLQILLFGSVARGQARPDSDIDILVVMPDGTHRRNTMTDIYRALLGSKLDVDVVVATVSDLKLYGETSGLIYRQALTEGVQLYAA